METVFLENLRHAAGVLAQVRPRTNGHIHLPECPCVQRGTHWGEQMRHKAGAIPAQREGGRASAATD